jgi:REase_DpnII-MboI
MARAKSERARSKQLAIDDLTQSIEQLQAFIPKLEDLGREGFPYLEGAQTRTELQLRECIKRAFGEKSPEFQTHRHLKLSIASSTEKKQTVALIRNLIASLEEKKLELQGLKPAAAQSANIPQMTLVPPTVSPAQVSMTSVATTPRPTGATLQLVPEDTPPPAPPAAAAPAKAIEPTSPVLESAPPPVASPPVQPIPPRARIEPISSLFRTQETRPITSPLPEQSPPLTTSEPPRAAVPVPPVAPPPAVAPAAVTEASASPATKPEAGPSAISKTQEVPVAVSSSVSQSPLSSPTLGTDSSAAAEMDDLSTTKKLCQRFHVVARQLRLRGEYRPTVNIEDEFDLQDLMHALLRVHFDDIGTDEWTPAYTDGASRTTFLLDHDRLAIVVKKTRTGLSRKDLMDQVRADVERYRARGRCTNLLCFIYDPDGRVGNPRGLENELSSTSEHFTVDVVVAPK